MASLCHCGGSPAVVKLQALDAVYCRTRFVTETWPCGCLQRYVWVELPGLPFCLSLWVSLWVFPGTLAGPQALCIGVSAFHIWAYPSPPLFVSMGLCLSGLFYGSHLLRPQNRRLTMPIAELLVGQKPGPLALCRGVHGFHTWAFHSL